MVGVGERGVRISKQREDRETGLAKTGTVHLQRVLGAVMAQ